MTGNVKMTVEAVNGQSLSVRDSSGNSVLLNAKSNDENAIIFKCGENTYTYSMQGAVDAANRKIAEYNKGATYELTTVPQTAQEIVTGAMKELQSKLESATSPQMAALINNSVASMKLEVVLEPGVPSPLTYQCQQGIGSGTLQLK